MSTKDVFRKVKDLNLPLGKYALFGSAPMGIRGLRECHDADIVVVEDLWDELGKKGWESRISKHGSQYFGWEELEVFNDWKPGEWDVAELIREADIIDGLPFVKLERVLEWKKLMGREKDLADIELIEKFLRRQK